MPEISSGAGAPAPPTAGTGGSAAQEAARSLAARAALASALADVDRFVAKVPEMLRGNLREVLRERVTTGWAFQVARAVASGAGYAEPPRAAVGKSATPRAAQKTVSRPAGGAGTAATTPAGGSTRGEWGFLNDAHVSIEDKLFLFMSKVQKRNDDALAAKMREYRQQFVDQKGGGGLVGSIASAVKSVVPGGGMLLDAVELGLKQLGGPLLGGLVAALGMPQLAPLALKLGAEAGSFVAAQLEPGKGASGSASTSGSKDGEVGSPDEKLAMLELQRLVEKQNQMFNCISNILRNLHETSMNTIGNIR